MLRQVKEALGAGALVAGLSAFAWHSGRVSTPIACAVAGVGVLAAALRVGFVKMMAGTHVPGSLLSLDARKFALTEVDENTWRMDDGVDIHHFSVGNGPEHVLVLHGGPGAPPKAAWPGMRDDAELQGRFTFHFYHQRGSGLSTRGIRPALAQAQKSGGFVDRIKVVCTDYGLTRHLQDAEAIRRHLCARHDVKKIHVIGHSFGGFLSSLWTAEVRDAAAVFASMLLIAPADCLVIPNGGHDLISVMERTLAPTEHNAHFQAFKKKLFGAQLTETEDEMAALNRGFAPFYMATLECWPDRDRYSCAFIQNVGEALKTGAYEASGYGVTGMYFSMGMYHDYTPALRRAAAARSSSLPITLVHCEKDLQSEARTRQYVPALMADKFVVLPDVLHFPQFEAPDQFAQKVRDWLL